MADTVNTIQNLRNWLRSCPVITQTRAFSIDYSDGDPNRYAIFAAPSTLSFKSDVLGNIYYDAIQTASYYFAVTLPWGTDSKANASNYDELTQLISWISAQTLARNFPEIAEGTVKGIMPTLSPYPTQQGAETALYQITLQITYRRK